ncbi:GNAT family N-acetyltransferase [Massilia sp. 9I]|uniref:GNAT family N-acetyltransferase n=1 Tax=Massilia sp. 9I TaxID=2653152 RepID=UPI0012F42BE2|nr:GNAT family N-acetyltransferase [Massilia sp. 9I]VXC30341.1 GCN5-like N-acetyltransferase domain-containing protein [Massilia sp. 9I]
MILIRPATAADLPALFAYLGEQLAENGRDGILFQPMAPTLDGVPQPMRERFATGMATPVGQPGWRHVWVALDAAGSIAGHIDLRGRPEPACAHRTLLGMGVRHDLRRVGLGTRLVQEALGWARATGFAWVDLEVLSQNHKARALYVRSGFVETGEVPDLYRIAGMSVGEVSMSVRLG